MQPHPQSYALYEVTVRQARCLPPASFRFHLTMETLALGCVIPAIRAHSGLAPVRHCSCRAYMKTSPLIMVYGDSSFLHSSQLKNSSSPIEKPTRCKDQWALVFIMQRYKKGVPIEGTPYKKVILLVLYANSYADSQSLLDEIFNIIWSIFHTNLYITLLSTFHANL